jgi:AraC-like DNA-binding protein
MPEQAAEGIVAKGMIRVGTLMPLPDLLEEHGIDPARLLAEFGLETAYLEEPENTIAFATFGRLLRRCAEVTHCPHFGLLVGARQATSALGAVGFLALNAADVRTALKTLAQYFRVHNTNAAISVVEGDSYATFRYTILQPKIGGREQILDGAMALAFNIMRELCGKDWRPTEVRFAHARPLDPAPFRRVFDSALCFDAGETALIFAGDWLDKPVAGADRLLQRMMSHRVGYLESRSGEGLAEQLRRMLPGLVEAGTTSLASMAQHVGLGARTLNRRLAAEGKSFVQLRDEARYAIACQLLENTHLPVIEIADRLGYANASAFTRAFTRWSGKAPAQWRASRRGARKSLRRGQRS